MLLHGATILLMLFLLYVILNLVLQKNWKRKCFSASSIFTQEQIIKIIDPACKNPCDFGYEVSKWSLALLTTEIKKQGIAGQISEKSVSRCNR